MAQEQMQHHCNFCGGPTRHVRDWQRHNPSVHILHAFVTLLTAGLWAVGWFFCFLLEASKQPPPFRCAHCGAEMGQKTPEQIEAEWAAAAVVDVYRPNVIPTTPPEVMRQQIEARRAEAKLVEQQQDELRRRLARRGLC